jgi:hypothetical protein
MTEDENKNENSIIPIGSSGLVRVGNSINVARKVIGQGSVLEKIFSKVYAIPFKKEDGWYLYNKNTNTFFQGPYEHVGRNKEFILCLDFNKIYWLFKNDQIICHFRDFTHDNNPFVPDHFAAPFIVIENKFFAIFYYKGKNLAIHWILDFSGNLIEHSITENALTGIIDKESRDDLKIEETFWKLNKTTLYYKNHTIISIENRYNFFVSDFHYGHALVLEHVDYDDWLGDIYDEIGYIDVYGNYYW